MQCWSCEFENIPGLSVCARCGSALVLSGVAVEPPRASRLKALTWLARARYRLGGLAPDLRPLARRLRFLLPERLPWRALAWSFIPGLGHVKTNRLRLGRRLLIIWLVLLLLTVFSIGTSWCWLWFSGLVVAHAVALLSLFAANLAFERIIVRAAFGMLLFLCLNVFVYGPVRWLCTRFASAIVVSDEVDGELVRAGDGLLVAGPWLRPDSFGRGELVVCRIRGAAYGGYVVRAGYNIERVVAVPGDRVQLLDGAVLVNGRAPPKGRAPRAGGPPGRLELVLGSDEYLVLPSFLRRQVQLEAGFLVVPLRAQPRRAGLPAPVIRRLSVFRYADVLGRVVLRLHPVSRFGRVE